MKTPGSYCNWSSVAGRSINTSAFRRRCAQPCCAHPPRAATSTGSFVDASPILWPQMPRQAYRRRRSGRSAHDRRPHLARTVASLPAGSRITDYISLGVLTKTFPLDKVMAVVAAAGKTSRRQRDLPAQVVVYYVIALTLYMQVSYREVLRCLLEGLRLLLGPEWEVKVAGKSGISQARTRLGWEPLKQLHDQVVAPIAVQRTKGAWYRHWRSVSLDGSTLEVADNQDNEKAFGRPSASRGTSAYPQVRFVSLVENGTHVLFGTQMSGYRVGEITLAHKVLPALKPGMLCLADRNFYGYDLWTKARDSGADLLWRVKKNLRLPCEERLSDGSYLSTVYRSDKDRRRGSHGIRVRVIEYTLEGVAGAEPISAGDEHSGSRPGAGPGTGGAVKRTLGNRDRPVRTENALAWIQNRPAQQDARPGTPGILRTDDDAFCHPGTHARSGPPRSRRSRPTLLGARSPGGPPQTSPICRYSPLRTEKRFIRRCSPRSWKKESCRAAAGRYHGVSSAR